MRQRKIHPGNAESVIDRGRNVTIVPFENESAISVSRNERRSVRWPIGINVIGGGEPENPDSIDVNDAAFPGWRVYAYDCANSPCTAPEASPLYVEIINRLGSSWTNAYMVLKINHAGASPTDYLFRVQEISIVSNVSDVATADLTYGASGMINTSGVYTFQIAATAGDGSRRMTMFTVQPEMLATFRNSDLVEIGYNARSNPVTLYVAGLFERYDGLFTYPTGPNQPAASFNIPFIIRFTP